MIQSRSDDRIIYIIIRTVDQRPKLYALRTTWDDVFEPRILYDLDIKVNIGTFIIINRVGIKMIIAISKKKNDSYALPLLMLTFRSKLLIATGQ